MTRHRSTLLALVLAAPAASPLLAQNALPEGAATPLPGAQAPAAQPGDTEKAQQLWEDFIHYLRIAQVDLATSSAKALLATELSPEQLLQIVDERAPYRDYDETIQRARRMDGEIAELAAQVENQIREARLALAREDARIRRSIEALDDGLRARLNAVERLNRAGEYAAPALLNVLTGTDDRDRELTPYVIEAMVAIGRPMVTPLSEALADLPEVTKMQVAEVLGRIGYPQALPYLKAEIERQGTSGEAGRVMQIAFDRIIERTAVPQFTDAARLFYILGEDYYNKRESLMLNPDQDEQLLWSYSSGSGLAYLAVPTRIYGDVMAMRSARRALQLNQDLAPAMSLWLAANFRRENTLAGAEDPSYPPTMQSPDFYATLAGPRHVHPVLHRALSDANPALALDAISALASTAGSKSLVNRDGRVQPLLAALNYPDRRVRFEAAFAIARSVPHMDFAGADRVVPVLAEAVRQGDKKYAVAIASGTEGLNQATNAVETVGKHHMLMGNSVDNAAAQIADVPGVDLLVVNAPAGQAQAAVAAARDHAKLAATPIVVLTNAEQAPILKRTFADVPGVFVVVGSVEPDQLKAGVQQAADWAKGDEIAPEQSLAYAVTALELVRDLAISSSENYDARDAKPALLEALSDSRQPVVLGAAQVLTLFDDAESQRALATAALDDRRSAEMRIHLLREVASSARAHGNQLQDRQIRQLQELVSGASGELADAASETYGALNLPTARAIEAITAGR